MTEEFCIINPVRMGLQLPKLISVLPDQFLNPDSEDEGIVHSVLRVSEDCQKKVEGLRSVQLLKHPQNSYLPRLSESCLEVINPDEHPNTQ